MVAYITAIDSTVEPGDTVRTKDMQWRVGDPSPTGDFRERVTEIQADGDELAHIIAHFSGIPVAKNCRVMTWFGEAAKFIGYHLK